MTEPATLEGMAHCCPNCRVSMVRADDDGTGRSAFVCRECGASETAEARTGSEHVAEVRKILEDKEPRKDWRDVG